MIITKIGKYITNSAMQKMPLKPLTYSCLQLGCSCQNASSKYMSQKHRGAAQIITVVAKIVAIVAACERL